MNIRERRNQRCVEIDILSNMRGIWFSLYAAFEKALKRPIRQATKTSSSTKTTETANKLH